MSRVREFAEIYFNFLKQFGYKISDESADNVISFIGKNNRIDVLFSTSSYELTCQFVDADQSFSLQDGLMFGAIEGVRGLYQIANRGELEKGIAYLAEAVRILFEKIDVSNPMNFQKIYKFRVETHKDLLEKYYIETDLKKAEDYWRRKEYAKAKELFEKNSAHLSNVQHKKLEYITNGVVGK